MFIDGPVESPPHPSIKGMFDGPFYSWFDLNLKRKEDIKAAIQAVVVLLYNTIKEQGPFDGVIGFSQGASVACAFILQHMARKPLDPSSALFKYALLFSGADVVDSVGLAIKAEDKISQAPGQGEGAPSEQKKPKIGIPSLHVCGELDENLQGSLSLMERFDTETAELVMHKLGHTIPRDGEMVDTIMDGIGRVHRKAMVG